MTLTSMAIEGYKQRTGEVVASDKASQLKLSLRSVAPEDEALCLQMREAAFRGYIELNRPWDDEEERQHHGRRFREQVFRIIELDSQPVGFVATVIHESHLRVYQLMVHPDYQGRGIGGWCLERLLEQARSEGRALRLQCMKANPRALAFYERYGFVTVGDDETHLLLEADPAAISDL